MTNEFLSVARISAQLGLGRHACYQTAGESSFRLSDGCHHELGDMVNPTLLRSDNFFLYVTDRATRILDRIEKAMGKAVSGRDSEETKREFGQAI